MADPIEAAISNSNNFLERQFTGLKAKLRKHGYKKLHEEIL
jgi:hypothetical protein